MLGNTKSSFRVNLRIESMRFRYRLILLFCPIATVSQADELAQEFVALLNTQSCERVWNEAGFSLDVLGRSFPVPRGFRFVGLERNQIVFRRTIQNTSKALKQIPNEADVPLRDKVLSLTREFALITYEEKRDIVLGDTGVSRQVTALQWNGLDIYFWISEGGRIVATRTHQAVIRVQNDNFEVGIAAMDIGLLGSLIGCSR